MSKKSVRETTAVATRPVGRPEGDEKPLKPAQCRAYMRKVLASEFRGIVDGFVKEASSGSCQHVKLATEFLEPKRREPKPRRGKSSLDRWAAELDRVAKSSSRMN